MFDGQFLLLGMRDYTNKNICLSTSLEKFYVQSFYKDII
jgi:hypothetical protein